MHKFTLINIISIFFISTRLFALENVQDAYYERCNKFNTTSSCLQLNVIFNDSRDVEKEKIKRGKELTECTIDIDHILMNPSTLEIDFLKNPTSIEFVSKAIMGSAIIHKTHKLKFFAPSIQKKKKSVVARNLKHMLRLDKLSRKVYADIRCNVDESMHSRNLNFINKYSRGKYGNILEITPDVLERWFNEVFRDHELGIGNQRIDF